MSFTEGLAKLDRFMRPLAALLPAKFYIDFYSRARREFLSRLVEDSPKDLELSSWIKPVKLWDIEFNNTLFNAAGMFKNGKGYEMSALQGAGAWLAGSSTSFPRSGNEKLDILHPMLPLPRSKSAVNWLGLPNDGHNALAGKISRISKIKGCPIGVSISSDPSQKGLTALKSLIEGMNLFSSANVDFIELNESCPNVASHSGKSNNELDLNMLERIEYLSQNFLIKRDRNLPVIVKYSVDTDISLLEKLIPILIDLGFDGINLGNTSITYSEYTQQISDKERDVFTYFTENFGGGVSGSLIKNKSLSLCRKAKEIIDKSNLSKEFNIIRTGGISSKNDLKDSFNVGASLSQWYTGYFENFAEFGHQVYMKMYK